MFERILFDKFLETKKIISTLRYMDNYLDVIFSMIKNKNYKSAQIEIDDIKNNNIETLDNKLNRFLLEGGKINNANSALNEIKWTQDEQQKLEAAMLEFKDVKDPKEKWKLIAGKIPPKTIGNS